MSGEWRGKIVDLYDLWWEKCTIEELPFWLSITENYFKNKKIAERKPCIVELCSGTGRILIPVFRSLKERFPEMQLEAIGIDYSPDMNKKLLELANKDIRTPSISVRDFDLREKNWKPILGNVKVDIFLLPFNHLGLMGDPKIQENIVRNVASYLVHSGMFILVDYNPFHHRKNDIGKKIFRRMIPDIENNRVLFYWRMSHPIDIEHKYAQITYAVDCVEWKDSGLHYETLPATMTIYYNTAESLDSLLHKHKLKVSNRYGDYNEGHFTKESPSQIVIAKKV